MAKATITYDLTDPDDRLEHLRAIKATDMALVIWNFVHNTRKQMEAEIQENGVDAYTIINYILEDFSGNLDEHGIVIDDLVV
jgi:hypothetical protein